MTIFTVQGNLEMNKTPRQLITTQQIPTSCMGLMGGPTGAMGGWGGPDIGGAIIMGGGGGGLGRGGAIMPWGGGPRISGILGPPVKEKKDIKNAKYLLCKIWYQICKIYLRNTE